MAIDKTILHRRAVLTAATLLVGTGLGLPRAWAGDSPASMPRSARLVGGARIDRVDRGAVWSEKGVLDFAMPGRTHAAVQISPTENVLLVGRRPGSFAALFDPDDADHPKLIAPAKSFRFAGHAATNGAGLIATGELHEDSAEGIVVLRDAASGTFRESWVLGGIEPHDLLFADGGAKLVVALGGIAHAAGVKGPALNAGKIESAIVELDAQTGRVLHRHVLPAEMSSLSLRHMALAPDGRCVVFGMQDQDKSQLRPLMGLLRLGRGFELFSLPQDDPASLRFYIGSVAIDASGRYAAATSPRGGTVALWSLADGRTLGRLALGDVCGLAADREDAAFWVSSGLGDIARLHASDKGLTIDSRWRAELSFDNHLSLI